MLLNPSVSHAITHQATVKRTNSVKPRRTVSLHGGQAAAVLKSAEQLWTFNAKKKTEPCTVVTIK